MVTDTTIMLCFATEEKRNLENSYWGGYQYTRKRSAYQARAQYLSPLDSNEWEEMLSFFNYVCCNCECEVIGGRPTKDHIIPITYGGTNNIKNLQPLCRECNTGNTEMDDYRYDYCERHDLSLPNKWKM